MSQIKKSKYVGKALIFAQGIAFQYRHEFITPEHILSALFSQDYFIEALQECLCHVPVMEMELTEYIKTTAQEQVPKEIDYEPKYSVQTELLLQSAHTFCVSANAGAINIPHIIQAMLLLPESWACYFLSKHLNEKVPELINHLTIAYEDDFDLEEMKVIAELHDTGNDIGKSFTTCLNDRLDTHNPLIGREKELDRTIEVLCRKDKNNPLHVGEPGVGKTSMVYGLAARIEAGQVPDRMKGSRIYELDLGGIIAGTQYRGELEERLKNILKEFDSEKKAILYIDEIHNIIGAGQVGESSMDISNILKPYLEKDNIRFIGSTTYEEYNRYFLRSKGMVRRFQQIDIQEPSIEECIQIIEGLKESYEQYHQVTYEPDVIEYAVKASARYINNRFLPDKAIDLIDEAGAYREIHPREDGSRVVDKKLVTEVLSRICKIDANALKEEDNASLESLYKRIAGQIYGQDEAIKQVVEAVQMAKAGLLDENKPLASLLFVGPTGVGKTEVTKVLAEELGISLIRFDMSEYMEKHTVAKLIGSPAGYVGYDDGGLLTDAIRKSPNCVLLLDEIEKAHPDVFNLLLQIMDYATITDNKGQKSDCRHLILIMTSNAGAQYAHQASIGFNSQVSAGQAMLKQVKKTFKPEFLNRLSATVVFHDMSREMAVQVLDKKLHQLDAKLAQKHVSMQLTPEAHDWLLNKGFKPEYGAREMDRAIGTHLKPLLMHEILFGSLKQGGNVKVIVENDQLSISKQ